MKVYWYEHAKHLNVFEPTIWSMKWVGNTTSYHRRASDVGFLIYVAMLYLFYFSCLIFNSEIYFLFELSTSEEYFFFLPYTNQLLYLYMETVFLLLVLLQMHDIKLHKCHLSLRGSSTLVSWACLCSLKKIRLRLLGVICPEKAKKLAGWIVLAIKCVWVFSNTF